MGMLEDNVTEYTRMAHRDARIKELEAALLAFTGAAKDVQDYWGDPGSYTHNRLLTPMLVHEGIIRTALEETKGRGMIQNVGHIIAASDECDTGVALTQAINETLAEDEKTK